MEGDVTHRVCRRIHAQESMTTHTQQFDENADTRLDDDTVRSRATCVYETIEAILMHFSFALRFNSQAHLSCQAVDVCMHRRDSSHHRLSLVLRLRLRRVLLWLPLPGHRTLLRGLRARLGPNWQAIRLRTAAADRRLHRPSSAWVLIGFGSEQELRAGQGGGLRSGPGSSLESMLHWAERRAGDSQAC